MAQTEKLSLLEAIFINITIMIGTGVFINTVTLAQKNGSLVGLNYIFTGLCLLPIVFSLSRLVNLFPSGGFYAYATETIHPFVGFISSWIYFFAKLGSCTISIHTFVCIIHQLIPFLNHIPLFLLDISMFGLCVFLNTRHIKTGSSILRYFFLLKMIPLCTVIFAGIWYGTSANIYTLPSSIESLPLTIPLIIFTLLGFEASCSLSGKIENASKNGPLAILISFSAVIALNIAYQLFFYAMLGNAFLSFTDYRDAFPALFAYLIPHNQAAQQIGFSLIHGMIATSALSGGFGMMYSLLWNLPTLAEHNHLPFKSLFTHTNKYHIPVACAYLQGAMCLLYLFISHGNPSILQQLAALGCTITYAISAAGLYVYAYKNKNNRIALLALSGLGGCVLLASVCALNLYKQGFDTLILLCILILAGIFFYQKPKALPKETA